MHRVLALWRALDDRFASVEPHPWGAVVTDHCFPAIRDVNYARVETDDPSVGLEEIYAALAPALERAGAVHRHAVVFHPEPLSDVVVAAGKRWFSIHDQGREAALGSLVVAGDVALVDHVVTLPFARRRGYAEAIVRQIADEARAAGVAAVVLLAEPTGPARRLYERIGFRTLSTIASTAERR